MTRSALLALVLLALAPGVLRADECSDSCRRTTGAERPGGPVLSLYVDCVAACGEAAASTATIRGKSDQDLEAALDAQARHSEIIRKTCEVAQQVQNASALAACPKAVKRLQKAIDAVRGAQADRSGKPRPAKKPALPAKKPPTAPPPAAKKPAKTAP
ncbi:MAG: hypothetical protein A2X36_16925 [Elusimicrobia bacterium GWA2_69_24]|nr:MAG: hypothetical protein A2X36_16925 [Elusimicrobia bacterium GWA2_69_24]HBL16115.1 hypothetical protein [Elusimicrobiota bacterium]